MIVQDNRPQDIVLCVKDNRVMSFFREGSLRNPPPTYSNPALSMSGVKENSLFLSGSGNFFNKASQGNDSICACFSANISTRKAH